MFYPSKQELLNKVNILVWVDFGDINDKKYETSILKYSALQLMYLLFVIYQAIQKNQYVYFTVSHRLNFNEMNCTIIDMNNSIIRR